MLWAVGLMTVAVFFGLTAFSASDAKDPVQGAPQLPPGFVVFSVMPGDSLKTIAQDLKREGLISNELLFRAYVFLKGLGSSMQAGNYALSASMSFSDIVSKFKSGDTVKIGVTIFEGFDIGDIESAMNARFSDTKLCGRNCSKKIVLSYFKTSDFKNRYAFLADAPDGASLEGYLFPDTYQFTTADDHDSVAKKMLDNFGSKIDEGTIAEIKAQGRSVYEVVTMASMIEKEVRSAADKRRVAGVMMNRLERNMPLQIDATLAYITDKHTTRFSVNDTKIDSPYNTYVYRGLPKGPISNPGLDSLMAAVYPEKNDYFYYLTAADGTTVFSTNFSQHVFAKRNYMQ